ncbi:hypothetical protein LSTR_LSTR011973 [Laodelphax striatellus]|uniref:Cyclic nucleotide-binding domain-containing protein n=1 Tax=Laodelphax striatellus TaxID=195883 RepID=A0A482WNV1_LAOST|nr:hypothetical protein LSTR_LSTR011973 [Laodelphax striatellus]
MHFTMSHSAPGICSITPESPSTPSASLSPDHSRSYRTMRVAILGKGDVFGDSFWKDNAVGQSAANVRALTYCDLHTIKRDKLLEVLDFYQAFANSFALRIPSLFQLIFRKVADVRREKELAERRKNEPQLDQNQDHLVRKIFSKFRRDRAALQTQLSQSQSPQPDVEKGEKSSNELLAIEGSDSKRTLAKLTSLVEKDDCNTTTGGSGTSTTVTPKVSRPTTIRASKWGRILGSSLDSGSETATSTGTGVMRSASVRDSPAKSSSSATANGSGPGPGGGGNKVFPKLQKVTAAGGMAPARQDTIEEIVELEDKINARGAGLRKFESYDSGIIRSSDKCINEGASGTVPFRPAPAGTPAEYKEIISNIMDFKVDVKLEVQRLNQKVSRMEELLTEVLSRIGSASPSSASQGPESGAEGGSAQPRGGGSQPPAGEMGAIILRKRRAKSRTKAAAPLAPPPVIDPESFYSN